MKLIIDIPEDVYTRLFDSGIQDNEIVVDDVCEIARALRLGTPLDDVKAEQRPKGHWIEEKFGLFRCDKCNGETEGEWNCRANEMKPFDFCPCCGADMRGEKNVH